MTRKCNNNVLLAHSKSNKGYSNLSRQDKTIVKAEKKSHRVAKSSVETVSGTGSKIKIPKRRGRRPLKYSLALTGEGPESDR